MTKNRVLAALLLAVALAFPVSGFAEKAAEVDANVDAALKAFVEKYDGAQGYLDNAKGVLVFPKVVKAGFIIAGEAGNGALRIGGKTVDYYNTVAGSIGLQAGGASKSNLYPVHDGRCPAEVS